MKSNVHLVPKINLVISTKVSLTPRVIICLFVDILYLFHYAKLVIFSFSNNGNLFLILKQGVRKREVLFSP